MLLATNGFLSLKCRLSLCVTFFVYMTGIISVSVNAQESDYRLNEIWFTQPIDHNRPDGNSFKQQIHILQPKEVPSDTKVFFVLGNETDATQEGLIKLYRTYGSPKDMIFIQAEHRGYGQSLSEGDQTKPDYVRVAQALNDYHRVVEYLKPKFPGQWIAAGYSYGGALVINFAHQFPQDVDAILSSSAPIYWPFLVPQYSRQVNENLGEGFVKRLMSHNSSLMLQHPYDEQWQQRELLTALSVGLTQRESMQWLKPYVSALSYLPTSWFTGLLSKVVPEEAFGWAMKRIPQSVTYNQAKTGTWNWYTWKYQQCTEVGTFFSDSPFVYSEVEHIEDCRQTFGEDPGYFQQDPWDVANMIDEVKVPQVIVAGAKDPWTRIGVQPDHNYHNIDYVYVEQGYHCPDRDSQVLGESVMVRLREKLTGK